MASSKEYLTFILEQLSDLDGVSYRAMMGEYILYYKEKIIGGIYDDRLLVKPVKAAQKYIPEAVLVSPYPGAKEMLLVDNVDSKDYLTTLFKAMFDELPAPKAKRKNK
ncbi:MULTISPECIES: TfoX/Sxy family protein [Streptococcus]|jgi:tfoX N-terminal domain superfamily|uniref:TfoX/Sxy family protein n=1 Tax=Streptococcus gordonii TaxID=1302 RepID=A0AB35FSM5_STRGN|nr:MULTISPECIES: TfoX/Sxy family protein [Streptococcus]ATF65668.1 competence protein TfoX [Streptococcus gordonii]MBS6245434.1 TfoX/Sxy family protein [Streptococcus sp.]MBW7662464.1 TfoX/Sxy family protein [Streptococcus gordonii]MBZ2127208.1 TfoX/Sxy family protein [Streptococcus gordonii]MBZ2129126.1 TfoX/Sxy family protein [Streptococcus gordonii]